MLPIIKFIDDLVNQLVEKRRFKEGLRHISAGELFFEEHHPEIYASLPSDHYAI